MVTASGTRFTLPCPEKGFDIAVAAGDGGRREADDAPALFFRQPSCDFAGGLHRRGRVAYDAALAERSTAELELRLDQEHAPGARLGQRKRRRQGQLKGDEA